MAELDCKQCGRCCLVDVSVFVTAKDRQRWEQEGRQDILETIEPEGTVWSGGITVSPQSGEEMWACPFLAPTGDRFICSIHETRPTVCEHYAPGSSELCSQFGGKAG
ncbi:MAG: YkgJ family cysteine cluster protein [Candidatus Latescibacteria bacterium]|jgi:Fe-S-cluster containining protein|nr:YkgJ family cysteine cluster protein [Candidatus Latescibacterota bacterium]